MLAQSKNRSQAKRLSEVTQTLVAKDIDAVFALLSTLLGGILFVFTADNRNPYCEWFCPFGAAQECMSAIGGAKPRTSREQQRVIDWIQRGMSWLAIIIALLLRNPGVTSYEIFGTLFKLNGTMFGFAVLGVVLITSMISHRFWCRALCPVRPVEGMIRLVRKWIIELWQTKITTRKTL